MKRLSLISLLILSISLPAFSQFWMEFGWNDPSCRQCSRMTETLRMSSRQAKDYHKIVHKYGKNIEKQTRRDYRQWDKAARKIYDLRVDRDRKIQRILDPRQFNMYMRYTRERPQLVHDYQGWYENPKYAHHRHSPDLRRYEDRYWGNKYNRDSERPRQSTPPRKGGKKQK